MLPSRSRRIVTSLFLFLACAVSTVQAQQVVYLNFAAGAIVYTPAEQATILSIMDGHYAPWDYSFTLTAPTSGPFSTVTFNSGSPGGLAQHIDFGNTDMNDTAVVNVDGLGIVGRSNIIMATANIGSHELGHLVGLRHADSFGPIGSGIAPGLSGNFGPNYPGPQTALETYDHIMASPGSVGSTIADVTTPNWFSERGAIKLTLNETPSAFINEAAGSKGTIGTAQALAFESLIVPNTIAVGANAGIGPFDVDAIVVNGELSVAGETDFYSFAGSAGDLMNIELLSSVNSWRPGFTSFDTFLRVFDSNGMLVPYYSGTARMMMNWKTWIHPLSTCFCRQTETFLWKSIRSPDSQPVTTSC